MSASVSCVVFAMRRRSAPTRRVSSTKNGNEREGEQRELPAEQEHRHHRRHDRRHVRRDRRGGGGDDVLDAADVVGDPRLHLARTRAREEREREPLQVAEDGGAQIVHHALADLVREQRLPDADGADDDGDHDHPGGEERELLRVLRVDRVQGAAQQERRDHTEDRGQHDQREHGAEPQLVRLEQPPGPAQRGAADRRVGGPLGLGVHLEDAMAGHVSPGYAAAGWERRARPAARRRARAAPSRSPARRRARRSPAVRSARRRRTAARPRGSPSSSSSA